MKVHIMPISGRNKKVYSNVINVYHGQTNISIVFKTSDKILEIKTDTIKFISVWSEEGD